MEQRLDHGRGTAQARHSRDRPAVGRPSGEPYLTDSGFIGATRHAGWADAYGARVICPPYRSAAKNWPPALRRWLGGLRQVIESVNGKLVGCFRLDRDR